MIALSELIERLEKATGPDKKLDAAIWKAATSLPATRNSPGYGGRTIIHTIGGLPEYTSSIDAALTLVPEGWWAEIQARPDNPHVRLWEFPQPCRRVDWVEAATPALAICIAALKARSTP